MLISIGMGCKKQLSNGKNKGKHAFYFTNAKRYKELLIEKRKWVLPTSAVLHTSVPASPSGELALGMADMDMADTATSGVAPDTTAAPKTKKRGGKPASK